ncbi:hypothetical protein COU15_00520 [Candidatus Kaiserbacteria bacterium CG10_big_fil_rev_8_21_14_0_10_45_20]|uniref:Citrate transporter-like domain-containing protein n=1 Tax=Candidatus Kaiserbacteria bacterium CG10_big_fil_rev_8_21_14_0_10_45_20 TaxID=1974607 RepID=A0A2H0UIN8_9BACT|nr:MAG: hypothetical protein COU15_00520 [Candidatus Kaiserbacteria bacterium CG10_big_fil_rev_8_21_14_0_10_45_20]
MLLTISATILFVVGYILITLEHRYELHKALPAAALGAFLWILIAIVDSPHLEESMTHMGSEIFGLIMFLLAAMALVEILTHYKLFDLIRVKILSLGLHDRKQLWVMGAVTFFLSPIIDNLTATLVILAISTRFFAGANLVRAAAIIVISANAGGAWSPIGDVTTIMLWLAGKFTAFEVIAWGFLPSLALFFVSTFMLTRGVSEDAHDIEEEKVVLRASEKAVITVGLLSFLFPVLVSRIGLEPYFGLIFGLGLVGMMISFFKLRDLKKIRENGDSKENLNGIVPTHLHSDIDKSLAKVDLGSLIFFAGILLAVGALEHLGILETISHLLLGQDPTFMRYFIGNGALGLLSAVMDNIPLTAAAMSILHTTDSAIWVLLAITAGTGGSLLAIGSAAGVVAMGKVKELTFFRYLKIATLPAAAGYVAAVTVWYMQYMFFG